MSVLGHGAMLHFYDADVQVNTYITICNYVQSLSSHHPGSSRLVVLSPSPKLKCTGSTARCDCGVESSCLSANASCSLLLSSM